MAQRLFAGPTVENPNAQQSALPGVPLRRVNHGAVAWSAPKMDQTLWQPQDGATKDEARLLESAAVREISSRMLRPPCEPEDARMTGMTRSLMRRVMGLNVTARPEPRRPAKAANAVRLEGTQAQVA